MSLLEMFVVILCFFPLFFTLFKEKLLCDLPCGANKVCENYAGVPECVCKDGFTGEDNCTGTIPKMLFSCNVPKQELMTRSVQLPYCVTAFLQTDLFLVHLFFRERKAVPVQ